MGLVSCVVPVFNGERYIEEAIDSILAQTYRPLQIVVVDDGSQDGTRAVLRGYREQITYVWQPRAGPSAARNRGLSTAAGEYLAFLDADDVWHPEKLARQMARFQARPELDLCLTQVRNFWTPDLAEVEQRVRDQNLAVVITAWMLSSALARRTLLQAVGQFDPQLFLGEDTDWFTRVAQHGAQIEVLPDFLVSRRLHPNGVSLGVNTFNRDELLQHLKAVVDKKRLADEA